MHGRITTFNLPSFLLSSLESDSPAAGSPIIGIVRRVDAPDRGRRSFLGTGLTVTALVAGISLYVDRVFRFDANLNQYDETCRLEALRIRDEIKALARDACNEAHLLIEQSDGITSREFEERSHILQEERINPMTRLLQQILMLEEERRKQHAVNRDVIVASEDGSRQEEDMRREGDKDRAARPASQADYSMNEVFTEGNFLRRMQAAAVSESGKESSLRPGFYGVLRRGLSGDERKKMLEPVNGDLYGALEKLARAQLMKERVEERKSIANRIF